MSRPIQNPRWSEGVTDTLDTKGRTPVQELDSIAVPTVQMADATRSPWQRAWTGWAAADNNGNVGVADHSGVILQMPGEGAVVEVTSLVISDLAGPQVYTFGLMNSNQFINDGNQVQVPAIDRPFTGAGFAGPPFFLPFNTSRIRTNGIGPSALANSRMFGFLFISASKPSEYVLFDPPIRLIGQEEFPPANATGLVVFNNAANTASGVVGFHGRYWIGAAKVRP